MQKDYKINRYFKEWESINGKVIKDIELENMIQPGKVVIRGHIGKKPVKITRKRVRFDIFPFNKYSKKSRKSRKNRK